MTTHPEELEASANTRTKLVRTAVLYLPLAIPAALLALYSLLNFLGGATGAIVPAVIVGIFAFAFAFEGLSALRDLRAEPITSRGPVRRIWSRGGLLWFFRSHYLYMGKEVYTIAPLTAATLHAGDAVEIEHWPHTRTVIRVRLLEHGSDPAGGSPDPTRRTWH